VPPQSSAEAQQQLEELTSPTVAFVRERCVLGTGQKVECTAAYDAWSSWCHRNGHPSGTLQTFARNLRAAVPELTTAQYRSGPNRGKRFFHGLGVPGLLG
jgi:putative DNA primase/helicase